MADDTHIEDDTTASHSRAVSADAINFELLSKTALDDLSSLELQRVNVPLTNGVIYDLLIGIEKFVNTEAEVIQRMIWVLPVEVANDIETAGLTEKQLIDKIRRYRNQYKKVYTNNRKKREWRKINFEFTVQEKIPATGDKRKKDLEDQLAAEKQRKRKIVEEKKTLEVALAEVVQEKDIYVEEKRNLEEQSQREREETRLLEGELERRDTENLNLKEKIKEEKAKISVLKEKLTCEQEKTKELKEKEKDLGKEINLKEYEMTKREKQLKRIEKDKSKQVKEFETERRKMEGDMTKQREKKDKELEEQLQRKEKEKETEKENLEKKVEKENTKKEKERAKEKEKWEKDREREKQEMEYNMEKKIRKMEKENEYEKKKREREIEQEKKNREKKIQKEKQKMEKEFETDKQKREEHLKLMTEKAKEEIAEKTSEVEKLQEKNKELLDKYRGAASGKARLRKSFEELQKKVGESDVEEPEMEVHPVTKKTVWSRRNNTEIKAVDKDIIIAHGSDGIFHEGQRYYGGGFKGPEAKKILTDGKPYTYAAMNHQKKFSEVNREEKRSRAGKLHELVTKIACGTSNSDEKEERALLMARYLSTHKDEALLWAKEAALTQQVLTPVQAVNFQALLRLSNNKMRNMRTCLNNLNMNIFPSDRKIAKAKDPLITHVKPDAIETGMIAMYKKKTDVELSSCPFIRVKDIVTYIQAIIDKESDFVFSGGFNDRWWILFSGDKGGQHTKFHVEILNSRKVGSVDNVHIYCMFEATDSYTNMSKVWIKYREQIRRMQESDFKLNGKGVDIFLGGDYSYIDENLGHMGSSARYPSSTDKVELTHLRNHKEKPHVPMNCPVEIRTTSDYELNYRKNNQANGNSKDRHANGKHYFSVAEEMLFPLRDITKLAPASLHINLGIVVLLYDMLVAECRDKDGVELEEVQKAERIKLNEEWEEASIELSLLEDKLQDKSENIVELTNRMHRIERVLANDLEGNLELCKESKSSSNCGEEITPNDDVNDCKEGCIITIYDSEVSCVECDECGRSYHCFCEGLSLTEEMETSELKYYKCLACSEIPDARSLYEAKIGKLIQEEDQLAVKFVEKNIACDELKAKVQSKAGERETLLSSRLESIHVVRQAYHSNAIVGNHCMSILQNHRILTDVINDDIAKMNKFNAVFDCLYEIMKLVMAKRFLSEEEVKRVRDLCTSFGVLFHDAFPDRSITRKIHELIFNVPTFVENWKTLGLFSEQEGESKHNAVNQQLRVLACMREPSERLRLVLEREELRGFADKTMAVKPLRLCRSCSTKDSRHFLRSSKDGTKHCRNCEPQFFAN